MTEERRQGPCELHPQMDEKLTLILKNQAYYMNIVAKQGVAIAHIKATVENGLGETVEEASKTLKELQAKVVALDDFEWFRQWINNLRTNTFKIIVKWAFIGGIIIFVLMAFATCGRKFWTLLI